MKKTIGSISLVVGIVLAAYALTMNVSVQANVHGALDELYKQNPNVEPNMFANNDLMNKRLCYLILASALGIVGTILLTMPETIKAEGTDEQKQLLLSQLNMLGSIAGKLDVPVNEINEVMEPYGVTFEA